MPIERLVKKTGNYSDAEVDGDRVMIDLRSGQFFVLKGTARYIWSALDRTDDLQAICDELAREFAVEPEECRRDVVSFARQLIDAGFAVAA